MAAAIPFITIATTVLGGAGQISQGRDANIAAEFEARQMERNARASFAEGTRASSEHLRQGRIAQSNMRAQMAGSGGVTDDPGATETLGETGRDAKYNALAAMYSYKARSQGQSFQAQARRLEGGIAERASRWKGLSTVLSGATKAYELQYG